MYWGFDEGGYFWLSGGIVDVFFVMENNSFVQGGGSFIILVVDVWKVFF